MAHNVWKTTVPSSAHSPLLSASFDICVATLLKHFVLAFVLTRRIDSRKTAVAAKERGECRQLQMQQAVASIVVARLRQRRACTDVGRINNQQSTIDRTLNASAVAAIRGNYRC